MIELKDIIKTDKILKFSSEDTLSHALSRMRTSHDAGFVFDDQGKFIGIVNPYFDLIKSSFPSNAKVIHCLNHPPKIKINYSTSKVAELFIESKIHYLPVFDDQEKFLGIISARRLLASYQNSPIFNISIKEILDKKNKPIITVYEEDSISTAVNIFKKTKVSKLIVIGKDFKLKGILSHYDLISYLIAPKDSPHRGEREGNHIGFYHLKVKNFAKTYALTLSLSDRASHALKLILDKNIGSVVIVDKERHPLGIITTKDFLKLLIKEGNNKRIDIITKNLSQQSRQIVGGFFNHLSFLVKREPDVAKARLYVKEEKHGGLFEVALSLIPKRGEPKVIKREGKNLLEILNPISHIIKNKKD